MSESLASQPHVCEFGEYREISDVSSQTTVITLAHGITSPFSASDN